MPHDNGKVFWNVAYYLVIFNNSYGEIIVWIAMLLNPGTVVLLLLVSIFLYKHGGFELCCRFHGKLHMSHQLPSPSKLTRTNKRQFHIVVGLI